MFNSKKIDVLLALATQNKQRLDELEEKIEEMSKEHASNNTDVKAEKNRPVVRAEDYDKRTPQDPTWAAFIGEKNQLLAQQKKYIKRYGHADPMLDERLKQWDNNYKDLIRAIMG